MIQLTPAAEADLPEIAALSNWAYRGTGAVASWTVESYLEGERTTAEALRADLAANPEAQILVWRDESGELQGHCWLEAGPDGAWYLGLLSVRPDRQDRKLGRTLLAAAEDHARARGGRRMQMTVINVRDTLIAWYQRRGYGLTGETRPFPYGDERFGRPLRDDLCFVVLERGL
ncbi:MAG TPA: GNAT family N-acetyltransferase [Phenylobacterium sp.]|jgi:ribosomal protein S18 acetylase RimI-like enzyme|uniref:GNAT family N-acetyltransferase n=1 Tax=Phenylobacterium sp. TaxID=1871053 RepID=UPI002B9EDBB8|nr:GNAT family N-acetyltransferase [Phenylobacterium sp.]HXA39229.1 GNAT family N-acetyltransferase [Phenylobacterium sp.]